LSTAYKHPHFFACFFCFPRRPPTSPLFPYTTLFRSHLSFGARRAPEPRDPHDIHPLAASRRRHNRPVDLHLCRGRPRRRRIDQADRKSTRLNSSHVKISYAVFCLKKKKSLRAGESAV